MVIRRKVSNYKNAFSVKVAECVSSGYKLLLWNQLSQSCGMNLPMYVYYKDKKDIQ